MKSNYVVIAVSALAVGIGTLGISAFLSMKSELASLQQNSVTPVIPATPIASTQPTQATQVTQPVATNPAPIKDFESLSPCEQMDAIAKSGKSVAQFIADSGRYSEFEAHVNANCNWNAEQLQLADAILNPPVVTIPRIVREETIVVTDPAPQPPSPRPTTPPSGPWNNCNGIHEPGESYSVKCHEAQTWNDRHPHWPQDPTDKRVTDDFGEKPPATGYLVTPNPTENATENSTETTTDSTPAETAPKSPEAES